MNVALRQVLLKVKRKVLLEQLENGTIDCLIGTHAIQDDVTFQNVGLVITDEQHRFGVNQRQLLREKGAMTNVLFMTTPILEHLLYLYLVKWMCHQLSNYLKGASQLLQIGQSMNNMSKCYRK